MFNTGSQDLLEQCHTFSVDRWGLLFGTLDCVESVCLSDPAILDIIPYGG